MAHMQQKTERRISAALRLVLVATLLLAQIALVVVLSILLQRRMAVAYTALELVALVSAIVIYNRPEGGSYKFGWILMILALPVAGWALYLLWGGQFVSKNLMLKKIPPPVETDERQAAALANTEALRSRHPIWGRLATYLNNQGFLLYDNTEVTYLSTGEALLRDMLQHMEQAERFIFMEYYIMARGEIWDELVEIFRRKCAEGVEIKLLFDDFGSMMRLDGQEVAALRRMGVDVQVFNPVHQYVNRLYFNYRDHRKITCIDGDIAYLGGANIADEYAGIIERYGYWKDCGIRLEGEGAWGATREFLHMWQRLDGTMRRPYDEYRPRIPRQSAGFCQILSDGPDNNPVATAEDTFLHMLTAARHSVWITTPYLAIDESMTKALCLSGDSGVDVRLIMPGVPDHKFAYMVAESYFGQLMEHGVRIYTFTPGIIHAKTVLVDEETAFVGSVNMDYRSFQLHFECGAVLYDTPAASALGEDLTQTMAQSHLLTMAEWNRRPWHHKLLGPVLRLFAMWM